MDVGYEQYCFADPLFFDIPECSGSSDPHSLISFLRHRRDGTPKSWLGGGCFIRVIGDFRAKGGKSTFRPALTTPKMSCGRSTNTAPDANYHSSF